MSRVSARAAVAAVTTGTVAVSGMALAGCATGSQHDGASLDEASVTSPIRLGAVTALSNSATTSGAQGTTLRVQPVQQTILKAKDSAALAFTKPTITVAAGRGVDIGVRLTDTTTHRPLANQKVRMVVKLNKRWQTFKVLRTDRAGFAHYTANVLTTTQLTAIFDGGDAVRGARAGIATLTVPVAQPAPSVPTQASRAVTRTALTPTTSANTTAVNTSAAPAPAAAVGSSLGDRAVYLASLQAGKPYVYGGSGPYNFDCSGLVQYVFRQLGRSLPRTAEEQYEATTHVSQYSKQVGDLIFFGTPGNVYHVGIYAGNGNMWDSPHSGESVQLQAIWTTSYSVGRVY
jgi:cell wall-associated NlpC family hydrolase